VKLQLHGKTDESKQPNNVIKNYKRIYKSVNKAIKTFVTPGEFWKDERKVWPLIELYASALKQITN